MVNETASASGFIDHGDDGVDVEVETASMLHRFLPRNRFFFEIFGIAKKEQSLREYCQSQINNKIKYSRLNIYVICKQRV